MLLGFRPLWEYSAIPVAAAPWSHCDCRDDRKVARKLWHYNCEPSGRGLWRGGLPQSKGNWGDAIGRERVFAARLPIAQRIFSAFRRYTNCR